MSSAPSLPAPRYRGGSFARIGAQARTYSNIIYALMMHDIKNRFFGSGLGQIVMVIWPFAHIVLLMGIYSFTKRMNPYGDSIIQYSAVSVFPFIVFNYVTRWIVFSALTNKPFLNLPIIKPLDILIARTLLETVSIALVGILLIIVLEVMGYSAMPWDPGQALSAVLATLLLAIGMGFLNAPLAFILPLWNIVITLFIILLWLSSGVAFVASALPENIRVPLSYNPLLNCVEWFRASYYADYPTTMLDRTYVIECALVMLTLGLLLNRVLRRFY